MLITNKYCYVSTMCSSVLLKLQSESESGVSQRKAAYEMRSLNGELKYVQKDFHMRHSLFSLTEYTGPQSLQTASQLTDR